MVGAAVGGGAWLSEAGLQLSGSAGASLRPLLATSRNIQQSALSPSSTLLHTKFAPSAVLDAEDPGDPRQTPQLSSASMEPVSYHSEYVAGRGCTQEVVGARVDRYLDKQEGFLEEEVDIIAFIKQLLCTTS